MNRATIENVSLDKPLIEDYDFYYKLKSEPSNIYWAGHKSKPNYDNFKNWYIENVIEGKIKFYFINHKDEKIGAIYYNMIENNVCNYLGLAVTEKVQGMGIATIAVNKLIDHIKSEYPNCKLIKFLIREDNIISQKVHMKIGCFKTGKEEFLYLESDNKNIKMEEWIFEI